MVCLLDDWKTAINCWTVDNILAFGYIDLGDCDSDTSKGHIMLTRLQTDAIVWTVTMMQMMFMMKRRAFFTAPELCARCVCVDSCE